MSWVPAAFVLLLLVAVLYPLLEPRLTQGRRARRAHRGGVVHWYPNYDEHMQFEPRLERDIIPVRRDDLADLGYRESQETAIVPRTFRKRIAGDLRFRLWIAEDEALRPIWICCWQGVDPLPRGDARVFRLTRELLHRVDSAPLPSLLEAARDLPDDETVESALRDWESEGDLEGDSGATGVAAALVAAARKAMVRLAPPVVPRARRRQRNRTHKPRTRLSRTGR